MEGGWESSKVTGFKGQFVGQVGHLFMHQNLLPAVHGSDAG